MGNKLLVTTQWQLIKQKPKKPLVLDANVSDETLMQRLSENP